MPVDAATATRRWLESVVLAFELCPFAPDVVRDGRLRIAVAETTSPPELLVALDGELALLLRSEVAALETTLLVHPHALGDFAEYNAFLDSADALLRARGCEGVVQVASFHPDYRFAGAAADDAANWTNRSPHPMLHLLREQSVADAVDAHPDAAGIPHRNAQRLRAIGARALRARVAACTDEE